MIFYLDLEVLGDQLGNAGFSVSDYGLLEAALARARSEQFGVDVYQSTESKGAALLELLIRETPFTHTHHSGALYVLKLFAAVNGNAFNVGEAQFIELLKRIETREITLAKLTEWIATHKVPFA